MWLNLWFRTISVISMPFSCIHTLLKDCWEPLLFPATFCGHALLVFTNSGPCFCIQILCGTSHPSSLFICLSSPTSPSKSLSIHPSIHLPWIHLHKKMSCKYFGVECRCVSPLPVAHQPQSNRLCLFVQLKLFVPCFPWCARLYSLIKCHTFSFSPPSSFFVCVSWKQR